MNYEVFHSAQKVCELLLACVSSEEYFLHFFGVFSFPSSGKLFTCADQYLAEEVTGPPAALQSTLPLSAPSLHNAPSSPRLL